MLVFLTNLSLKEFQVRDLVLFLFFSVIDGLRWFWMGSLHKYFHLMLEFHKGPFLVLHFSYYTSMTFLMMLSVILLSLPMMLLCSLSVIRYLICGNNQNWLLNLNLIYKTLIGALTLSLLSNLPSKNGAFIRSVKFLFPEVALYLYKSNIWPCMEYCFHAWAVTPSSYLELLDKLQKWICRTIGPSLTASLESLTHRQNVASLNILYSYRAGKIR